MLLDIRNPDCTDCKLHQTAEHVCRLGFGPKDADIMVVGKMPNSKDWQEELELELEEMGLGTDRIYFASALKCRTFDQDASNPDVKACRKYLDAELAAIKPKYVLALGNEALLALVGRSGITKYRGQVFADGRGFDVIATISPAAVKRNPGQRPGYLADLRLFVNKVMGVASGIRKPKYTIIDTRAKLRQLYYALTLTEEIYFDVETHSDYFKSDGRIVTLSATCKLEGGRRFVFALPLYHPESPWKRKHRAVLKYLAPAFAQIPKWVAHNASYDTKWMHTYGVFMRVTFDTMLAIHILNENVQKGLKPQAQARLGVEPWGIDTKNLLEKPLADILEYNVLDTWYMYHIKQQLVTELQRQPRLARLFKLELIPALNDLVQSEMRGIYLDVERLKQRIPVIREQKEELETKILESAQLGRDPDETAYWWDPDAAERWPRDTKGRAREVNFNASIFARWMLFEHIGLEVLERGKDKPDGSPGDPSMKEAVLLEHKQSHPAVPLMLERVGKQKTLSSFFEPYLELYDEDHRIHTNFKLAGTVTGRLSSGKDDRDKISAVRGKLRGVNLQQVPRDPFVRGVFGAPPGWLFVEADYSQIELRIVAFLSRDPTMLHLYKTGADIHRATASNVLGIPPSQIDKDQRKKAKAVNFGFVYGMGWRKFIQTAFEKYGLHFTEEEAKNIRRAFFDHFSGLQAWHNRQRRLVNEYGRVQSPLGRIRHLPDIYSPEEGVQREAERQAINSPVQSFGSDMAVISMIEINKRFKKLGVEGHCIGLVHDAINFEIREDDVHRALPIIKDTMEDVSILRRKFGVQLDVPIIADLKVGTHWGDAEEIDPERVYNWKAAA